MLRQADRAGVRPNHRQFHYLGPWNAHEALGAYDALMLGLQRKGDARYAVTVGELCRAFIEHADEYYSDEDGKPTGEAENFRDTLALLCVLQGERLVHRRVEQDS